MIHPFSLLSITTTFSTNRPSQLKEDNDEKLCFLSWHGEFRDLTQKIILKFLRIVGAM